MTGFLDKETLQLIQDTAKKSAEVKVAPHPNNPEKSLIVGNGTVIPLDTPFVAGPRQHTVESISSFAQAFARWGGAEVLGDTPDSNDEVNARHANIWMDLGEWQLCFFCDEPYRRSKVTLNLTPSPQFLLMQSFATERRLDQKVLVRMLRHDLADCVDPGVLLAFRSVDFQKIVNARAAIEHGKQSMDSDVVAAVTGEKKPDSFLVNLPLFAGRELDARTRIGLTIDIDCDDRKFVLQAKPGQIEEAMDDARAAVIARLESELAEEGHSDVVILAGSPNE